MLTLTAYAQDVYRNTSFEPSDSTFVNGTLVFTDGPDITNTGSQWIINATTNTANDWALWVFYTETH